MPTPTDTDIHNPACAAMHTGPWAVNLMWLSQAMAEWRAGRIVPISAAVDGGARTLYRPDSNGIATIEIVGPTMKGRSKFGGTSTIDVRRALRVAATDPDVRGVMVHADSPGGTVAGTADLADDIAKFSQVKPIRFHIDDMGASALMWFASQADFITANKTALVGSIGALGVIEDTSKKAEADGVKVHVIQSGALKSAGEPGTEITDVHLAHFQDIIDGFAEHFFGAVKSGRGLSDEQLAAVTDARVMSSAEGVQTGLIDAVMTFDEAMRRFTSELSRGDDGTAQTAQSAARGPSFHERRHKALTRGRVAPSIDEAE